jgi:hypothetical protein
MSQNRDPSASSGQAMGHPLCSLSEFRFGADYFVKRLRSMDSPMTL